MGIDIRHIRQIEALARHKNFARAAKELHMTQPGLSRAIKSLESALEVQLFDRNNREITPTVFGAHIIEFGLPMLKDTCRLESDLKALKGGDEGELRIGLGPIPADIFMGKVLGQITQKHPNLHFKVIVDSPLTLFEKLKSREIDVMVGDLRQFDDLSNLAITDLPQHDIAYVCKYDHPLAGFTEVSLEDIFNYPIATPHIPDVIYKLISKVSQMPVSKLTAFKRGTIECNYFKLLIDVVLTSEAIGCGVYPIFQDYIEREKLVQLPLYYPAIASEYKFVTLANYVISPAVLILKSNLMSVLDISFET